MSRNFVDRKKGSRAGMYVSCAELLSEGAFINERTISSNVYSGIIVPHGGRSIFMICIGVCVCVCKMIYMNV